MLCKHVPDFNLAICIETGETGSLLRFKSMDMLNKSFQLTFGISAFWENIDREKRTQKRQGGI